MSDERFEEFLKQAARSHNLPPARTPREEMWNSIQATRSAGPRVVYGGGASVPRSDEKRFGSKVWWLAAAGIVLVASGIGIGRLTAPSTAPSVASTQKTSTARTQSAPSPEPGSVDAGPSQVNVGGGEDRGTQQSPLVSERSRVAAADRGSDRSSTSSNAGDVTPRSTPRSHERVAPGPRGSAPTLAYELAEANHLSAAEALLTSFRTRSPADERQDARLAAWARELLSSTRLLLDSPVAADPQRRPLLHDLELLLVQIVQLSPGSTPQDREIMEKTLEQDQLMTRLRTAIPAGQRGS